MVLTVGPRYCSCWIIQKSQKCIFEWSKVPKRRFLAVFWTLVSWINLILHVVIELYAFEHSAPLWDHVGSFKSHEKAFLNDPKSLKRGFLDLGLLDRLDIAYFGRIICFPTFGNTTRSWRVIQKPSKCIFEWSKMPKRGILAVFTTLVGWIDLVLHVMTDLHILQH